MSVKCVFVYMQGFVSGLFYISVMNMRLALALTLEPQTSVCVCVCVCVFKPLCMQFLEERSEGIAEVVPGQVGHERLKL